MKRLAALSAVAGALTTAGILAALVLAPAAAAYSPEQLPSLGYSVSVLTLTDGVCRNWSAGFGNAAKTDLGSDCDPGFQQRLDDFVKATCPCAQPATTTAPPPAPPTATDTTPAPAPPPASTTVVTTTVAAPLPVPPRADFTATAESALYVIAFSDASTSSSTLSSRVWQFGDGTAGTGTAPTHSYRGAGVYYVTLIIVDQAGLTSLAVHELTIAADSSISLGPRTLQAVTTTDTTTTKAVGAAWTDNDFFNPSGNIQCSYTPDGHPAWVACQTRSNHRVVWLEINTAASTFKDKTGHFGLKAKRDGGWFRIGHVLAYGETWHSHQFSCLSNYGGMRCWTSSLSHGFFINAWEVKRW